VRLTAQLTFRPAQHNFSTTAAKSYAAPKKASSQGKKSTFRTKQTLTIKSKKNPAAKTGKPPLPGERKALRKRIILSNTNALPVQMEDLDKATLAERRLVGHVVGLPENVVDSLRAAEAFKPTQEWGLFRRPGMLIRNESLELSRRLAEAEIANKSFRMVIDGPRVSGKSMMLLHAMTTAFLREWIVLNIPDGKSSVPIGFKHD
jgi:small subunit ribosomal protein S29